MGNRNASALSAVLNAHGMSFFRERVVPGVVHAEGFPTKAVDMLTSCRLIREAKTATESSHKDLKGKKKRH